jgi:RNA polymerase sigma-70 factor (ECF subfamily)
MGDERARHSLQATALVNEAYLRMVDANDVAWHDRAHFLAVAARVMRRILPGGAHPAVCRPEMNDAGV